MESIIKIIAGKFRRIILLQFGLITFRFAYGKDRNPDLYDFWIFTTRGNPYLWIWICKMSLENLWKPKKYFRNNIFCKYTNVGNQKVWTFGNGWGRNWKINFGGDQKQWALTMVWKKKTGNQHLGISIKSLRSWIILDDIEILLNPHKSQICVDHIGYLLDVFG